jgi:hypothetical protein
MAGWQAARFHPARLERGTGHFHDEAEVNALTPPPS